MINGEEYTFEEHLASQHMVLSDALEEARSEEEAAPIRLMIEEVESMMQHLRAE